MCLKPTIRYPMCEPFSCLQKPDADQRKAETLTELKNSSFLGPCGRQPKTWQGIRSQTLAEFSQLRILVPSERGSTNKLKTDHLPFHSQPFQPRLSDMQPQVSYRTHFINNIIISKKIYCTSAYKALTPTQQLERLCFLKTISIPFLKSL